MGWWNVEGTQDIIGDAPLDALTAAVMAIIGFYHDEYGRKPTASEWESLLHAVLGSDSPEERVTDDGVIDAIQIHTK